MPTSTEEARNIVSIINDYLTFDKAIEITKRLDHEVGSKTDNQSLKVSLQMLKAIYENSPRPPQSNSVCCQDNFWHNDAPLHLKLMLWSVVAFHMVVLFVDLVAMLVLPFVQPWYVALPVVSLLVNFMFSAVPCPLTRLESAIRRRMGLPEIRYFIQHYFFKPSWRRRRRDK